MRILRPRLPSARTWILFSLFGLTTLSAMPVPVSAQYAPNQPPSWPGGNPVRSEEIFGPATPDGQSPTQPVADVKIVGNETVNADQIMSSLRTRKGREFDTEVVQEDKRRLITTGKFREVKIYLQSVESGVVVTFEVFERPTIRHVRFHGDRAVREKTLLRESGLEVGEALIVYSVQEGRRKLEDFYHRKGFPHATVTIAEGEEPTDRGVTYSISEGPLQRIRAVEFVGNTDIASDARLGTLIQSKPAILGYFIRGKVDLEKVEQDVKRLTEYYRSLGYFSAKIGRQLIYDDLDQGSLTLRFVINEGRRYRINSVAVNGNHVFQPGAVQDTLNLQPGSYFNLDKMNQDVNYLRELYTGQGHVFASIEASPRFLNEPPDSIDMVYNIEAGEKFRVGRINIKIAGDFPHTRESVIRNRLSIRTGDIVDMREVQASERRLKASQLFENDPSRGKIPKIEIRPPQLSDADNLMAGRRRAQARGQSPPADSARR